MAGRRFDVADVVELLQHWQAGHSLRQLSRALGWAATDCDRSWPWRSGGDVAGRRASDQASMEERVPSTVR